MDILRRWPISDSATSVSVQRETVTIRAYQIVVWVSLALEADFSIPIPAILDTGHGHNFSVQEDHLDVGWNTPRRLPGPWPHSR
jgi:hypothetical protein